MDDVHPARLASVRKNLLINGGFRIWQRGTTFTDMGSGVYGPDGWRSAGSGALNASQSSDAKYENYALLVEDDQTGSVEYIQQVGSVFELLELLKGQTVTFCAWVKEGPNTPASRAGIAVRSSTANHLETVALDNTYQKLSVTTELPSDNSVLNIRLYPATGDGVLDASATGEALFDGVTLVVGDEPVDYPAVMRPVGQEQSLCERYYGEIDTGGRMILPAKQEQTFNWSSQFSTTKSAVPTVSISVTAIDFEAHSGSSITGDQANWSHSFDTISAHVFNAEFSRSSSNSGKEIVELDAIAEAEVT